MVDPAKYSYRTGIVNSFTPWDYVIFAAILVISAGIGFYFAFKDRKKKNIHEFLLAGRNMSPYPVALSLLASFMSAITLLGTPAEMYNYTTMYWWIGLSYLFVVAAAAHIFIPIFYRMQVTSAYEYLERRFSKGVRTAGSMTFAFQMVLYMAIVLYAPSLALNAVTGFTLWGSVISVGIVCTIYTTFGGMKAVLWTDTFQVVMMITGLLAVLIRGSILVGGFANAWEIANDSGRVYFTDFRVNPAVRHSVWSLVVGGFFTWVAVYGTNQAQVQRACTCPTLRKAQIAMWINFPGLCVILYLSCLIGIVMYAFYSTCDPLTIKLVSQADQLLPLFVMDVLGDLSGLPGIFVACLFSGALSTISSGLNSLAAVFLEDVIKAYIVKDLRQERATLISKVLAFVFGLICLGLTYVASLLGGVLQAALSLFGMIGGPLLGLFTLGMLFPWANKWGAYTGLFTSLIFMFWIGIGAQVVKPPQVKSLLRTIGCSNITLPPTTMATDLYNMSTTIMPVPEERSADYYLYTLSYMWYSATAVATTVIVGLIVSFITGPTDPKTVDPRMICPFFDIVPPFCFLPEKFRRRLWCGVRHDDKDEIEVFTANGKGSAENARGNAENGKGNGDAPYQAYMTDKASDFRNNETSKTLSNGVENPGFPPPYSEAAESTQL
ncbi:sodium-coupled monocarboxylate transporter 2 [Patella vulgata]|uniref:sodium-coupled monocarboxylate transporter 2 n=1 Tax=Patella vulgata TaxID=6465 RepID=UPI0021800B08|nr:sodium-coupled monocarboxylate transporter 2 [Patella vulgata]